MLHSKTNTNMSNKHAQASFSYQMKQVCTHIKFGNSISCRIPPADCILLTLLFLGCCLPPFDGLYGELSHFQSGYDMELLAGDACRHSGNYGNATRHYSTVHDMCPVRFAPLEGMLDVYIAKGDTANADKTAWLILDKKIKVPSVSVTEIQEKARKWVAGHSGEQAQ